MKKLLSFILIGCMLLSLAACGGAPAGDNTGNQGSQGNATYTADQNFIFTYKGTDITLHAEAAPIVAALGEPVKYTESTSCAFDGLDKSYYYGSFYLETYPLNGADYVYSFWFADDSITTTEGVYIGASQADVEKAYGTECYNGSNAYVISKDAGKLTVILENGAVSSIQYAATVS